MSSTPETDKPGEGAGAPAANPQAGSGEGSNTALEALIKKRKLRAEDESPSASDTGDEPDLSPAQ